MGTKIIGLSLGRCCCYRVQATSTYKYHKTYLKVSQREYLLKTNIFERYLSVLQYLKPSAISPSTNWSSSLKIEKSKGYSAMKLSYCLRDAFVTYLDK